MDNRDLQRQLQRARRRQIRRALWRILRERLLLVLGVGTAVLLMSGTLGYNYVHAQVYDDVCRPVTEIDLSLSEMATMNTRLQVYQLDPGRDAHVGLSSEESSFMLAQFFDPSIRVRVGEGLVGIQTSVRRASGCVAVDAVGTLIVEDRVASFTPVELRLGDLDVMALRIPVGTMVFEVADFEDEHPRLAEQLANIDRLEVVDGVYEGSGSSPDCQDGLGCDGLDNDEDGRVDEGAANLGPGLSIRLIDRYKLF